MGLEGWGSALLFYGLCFPVSVGKVVIREIGDWAPSYKNALTCKFT